MIPVSVVTGFLGSGKTSFIRRVLTQPGFGRTAVIVNEFGDISLDHDLIASGDDSVLTLNTGCLCCAVQTDLARTLMDLATRRAQGTAVFDRILIETSGLAHPGPILQALMDDTGVAATHRIDTVLTLADAAHGERNLSDHAEARVQMAVADIILVSKQDVMPLSSALRATVRTLNPFAPMLDVRNAAIEILFGQQGTDQRRLPPEVVPLGHADIETFNLVREQPIPALALTLLLQALAEHCGPRLLRLKGLISVEEMPGQPALIHGVHHVVSAPEFLDHWPTSDHRTRIVFIGKHIPRHFVARILDAIEQEVRDAQME